MVADLGKKKMYRISEITRFPHIIVAPKKRRQKNCVTIVSLDLSPMKINGWLTYFIK